MLFSFTANIKWGGTFLLAGSVQGSSGNQTTLGTNKSQEAGRGQKLNIHIQLDKSILVKLWGRQNTKFTLLMFQNFEI